MTQRIFIKDQWRVVKEYTIVSDGDDRVRFEAHGTHLVVVRGDDVIIAAGTSLNFNAQLIGFKSLQISSSHPFGLLIEQAPRSTREKVDPRPTAVARPKERERTLAEIVRDEIYRQQAQAQGRDVHILTDDDEDEFLTPGELAAMEPEADNEPSLRGTDGRKSRPSASGAGKGEQLDIEDGDPGSSSKDGAPPPPLDVDP